MVVTVENPANKPMHYGNKNPVGVLSVPDKLPNKIIYSGRQGNIEYDKMQYEMYQKYQQTKVKSNRKFPKILKILLGISAIATLLIFGKNIGKFCKKLIKRPFKFNHH